MDFQRALFSIGLGWLREAGYSDKHARGLLGQWVKLTGRDYRAVFDTLAEAVAAQQQGIDLVGYVQAELHTPTGDMIRGVASRLRGS